MTGQSGIRLPNVWGFPKDKDDEEQRSHLEHAARFHSPKFKFALSMLDEATCSYSEEKRKMLETALWDYVVGQMKDSPERPKNIMRVCDYKFSHLN